MLASASLLIQKQSLAQLFNLPETKKAELFYIIDLKPFGILKIPKQKTN